MGFLNHIKLHANREPPTFFFEMSDILTGFFDIFFKSKKQSPVPCSSLPFSLTNMREQTQENKRLLDQLVEPNLQNGQQANASGLLLVWGMDKQRSVNRLCHGPDEKYFRLCGQWRLGCKDSIPPLPHEGNHKSVWTMGVALHNKTFLQK